MATAELGALTKTALRVFHRDVDNDCGLCGYPLNREIRDGDESISYCDRFDLHPGTTWFVRHG